MTRKAMLAEACASGTPVPSSFAAERSAKLYRLLGAMNGVAVSLTPAARSSCCKVKASP
ncbi:hypothetical protein [Streptomyces sp. NPDC059165]|uniref:hypothetical protein n=1 Tax=Streptomyces sp. NPDC059165 TaxID=3346751 RepID=UPI0036AAC5A1